MVVLGAGFSKAVHTAMPLTNELGEAVAERLSSADQGRMPRNGDEGGRFTAVSFEEWLSYLAEEQPQHTEDQSLEARALLVRVTRRIHDVISEAQLAALLPEPPTWFVELLSVLNAERADVISFNYDNLIECGVNGNDPYHEDDIVDRLPRRADFLELREVSRTLEALKWRYPTRFSFPDHHFPRSKSLRLLKLHGSLSWFWVPGDPTGTTLQRWRLPGSFGHAYQQDDIDEERSTALPSTEPFIVPPAALKSEHLRNPVIREIWRRADQALRRAKRVVLIGYSLQPADRAFGGMLQEGLNRGGVTVEVVNPDAPPVIRQLGRLGIDRRAIPQPVTGEDCVRRWVEGECNRLASAVVRSLDASYVNDEAKLLVGNQPVEAIVFDEAAEVVLVQVGGAGRPISDSLPVKELRKHLQTASRVVVDTQGDLIPVIDWEQHSDIELVPARVPSPGDEGSPE